MDKTSINNCAQGLIVAVDGPSGAGKSTVCRIVAEDFGAKYLDTGAMYRVATLHVLNQGIDPSDTDAVIRATSTLPLEMNDDPTSKSVVLNGEDVSKEIRGAAVTKHVSAVSAIPEVRHNLVAVQRALATRAGRCILDGRDIGTNVLKDAPLKIFLSASAEVRAQRRYEQDLAAGRDSDFETVLADVLRRDHADSTRATAPLRAAEDAIQVDTSEMTLEQVIERVTHLVIESAGRTK
ncbi:(d)CMP kinase [Corynebacterium gerontici]|uniref:Cytidylate kinase n=1 Tax=Corynebacterium gerontici TaxID=2079234 RepID=A0A3G6J4N1_9CORY|nr:(d)CMP kinase [Corynebacterium gerontici]AZA11370.1 Cytidylate kinase [Corynebacterium gerontici]